MIKKLPCTCMPPGPGRAAKIAGCLVHDRQAQPFVGPREHVWSGGAEPRCTACDTPENLVASPECSGRPQ